MTIRLRVIVLIFLLIAFGLLIGQLKKKRLDIKYTFPWLVLLLVLVVIDIFPQIIVGLTHFVGIETPVNTLFLCGLVFSLIIIYCLTVAISKMSDQIRAMAQKIALLESEKHKEE